LQAQPQMAGGLPQEVIKPAAATSPAWVQHLVNWGGSIWTYHPIQAGAATVWIQVGKARARRRRAGARAGRRA
jgi:hypothetical protein